MANTTNFGWETPDDTDLVKDGAAAIRTLGSSIDTSLVDLKGGTTDQLLAKNSNTDMDFKWVAGGMSNPMTTTGDTIYSSSGSTPARLAIGTAGQVLTVNSGATAPEWATPAAGGMTLLQSLALSGASVTSSTFTPANYKSYYIVVTDTYAVGNTAFQMRLNADTGSNYYRSTTSLNDTSFAASRTSGGNLWLLATIGALSANGEKTFGAITIDRINDTTEVFIQTNIYTSLSSNADVRANWTMGTYNNSAAISSVTFIAATNNFSAGTAYIYGVN